MASTAVIPPPDASLEAYREVQSRLGLTRAVVVQPTTYGFDNRCTLDAMSNLDGRGVVVVPPSVSDEELNNLTEKGVRGIRFFMLPGGALPWDTLDELAPRVHDFGWHVQIQLNGYELPEHEVALRNLPGTCVIDHVGRFHGGVITDHVAFKTLLGLVERGDTWVKLSAPYEQTPDGAPDYPMVRNLVQVLVKTAPERMVWATNWPHPGHDKRPDDAAMLDMLLDWVDDEATRYNILVDNPARLYDFPQDLSVAAKTTNLSSD